MAMSKPFPFNAWYPAAWGHEVERSSAPGRSATRTSSSTAAPTAPSPRSRTPAGIGCCRCRSAGSPATRSSAATTASCSIRPAAAPTCRRRRRSILRPACAPIPSSSGIGSSGSGRAIRRLPIPRSCPISTGTTALEWKGEGGTFYSLKCDWRLVVDNLMDLTHETYVHSDSIGHDAILDTPFDVTHGENTATMTRWMIGIEPPPFWGKQLGKPGPVDRWQIVTFQAPAVVVGDVGVAPTGTGAPQGDRSQGVNGAFLAAIAPETETSCHYFWNFVRTFRTDDDAADAGSAARPRQRGPGRLRPGPCRAGGAAARHRPAIRASPSTISTSTPAPCGRGA